MQLLVPRSRVGLSICLLTPLRVPHFENRSVGCVELSLPTSTPALHPRGRFELSSSSSFKDTIPVCFRISLSFRKRVQLPCSLRTQEPSTGGVCFHADGVCSYCASLNCRIGLHHSRAGFFPFLFLFLFFFLLAYPQEGERCAS